MWWWAGGNADPWLMDARWADGQYWRPCTSCLLHQNWVHLLVNVYWVAVLGVALESVFGSWRMAGIAALLAFSSSVAEFAFAKSGVGLSGIAFGLFGLLWVLSRRDERFHSKLGRIHTLLFLLWGVVCIVCGLTVAIEIGNVAHAAGLATGLLLGISLASNAPSARPYATLSLSIFLAVVFAAATVGYPYVKFAAAADAEVGALSLFCAFVALFVVA